MKNPLIFIEKNRPFHIYARPNLLLWSNQFSWTKVLDKVKFIEKVMILLLFLLLSLLFLLLSLLSLLILFNQLTVIEICEVHDEDWHTSRCLCWIFNFSKKTFPLRAAWRSLQVFVDIYYWKCFIWCKNILETFVGGNI